MTDTVNYGLTNWDEEVKPANDYKKDNLLKLKLQQGDNWVRFITKPYKYVVHEYKEEGEQGQGDRVLCSDPEEKHSCPLCEKGIFSKERYLVGVIDRVSGQYKIVDLSKSTYGDVQKFIRNPAYGLPTNYDVNLIVDKTAPPPKYYTPQPNPPTPLSESDKKMMERVDYKDLERRVTPPTVKEVNDRLVQIRKWKEGRAKKAAEAMVGMPVTTAKAPVAESSDFTFPKV